MVSALERGGDRKSVARGEGEGSSGFSRGRGSRRMEVSVVAHTAHEVMTG